MFPLDRVTSRRKLYPATAVMTTGGRKSSSFPFPAPSIDVYASRERTHVPVRVRVRDADTGARGCRCGRRANALRRFSRPSVSALLARGCTCHRSWCFQRPHPRPRFARARARVWYAETRRLSYFLTIASRSPRSARIPFGPPRVQDAATDGAAAFRSRMDSSWLPRGAVLP